MATADPRLNELDLFQAQNAGKERADCRRLFATPPSLESAPGGGSAD